MISSLSLRPKAPTLSPMFDMLACLETLHPERFRQLNTLCRWLPAKWAVRNSKKPADFTPSEEQILANHLKDLDLSPARQAEAATLRQAAAAAAQGATSLPPPVRKRRESQPELPPVKEILGTDGMPTLEKLTLLFNHKDAHSLIYRYFNRYFMGLRKKKEDLYLRVIEDENQSMLDANRLRRAFVSHGFAHISERHMQLTLDFLELDLNTTLQDVLNEVQKELLPD